MPALVFDLERGDADGSESPQVWRVDEACDAATLARRFDAEWAAWYGPALAAAATRIGRLLAAVPDLPCDAARRGECPTLPAAWLVPVVRRRRRQLSIWRPAMAAAGSMAIGAPRQSELPFEVQLDVQLFWGATSMPGMSAGEVRWQACALHEALPAIALSGPPAGAAQLLLARQLRGGIGLLLVRPLPPLAAQPCGW